MRRALTTSQLFSRLLTSCQLFSTTVISVQLFLTLLNSLFMFLPSSQLFSAYLDSSHLSSTRPFFFSTRLKWHKCKLVQLLFHSLDSFDSFKLRSSCRKEIFTFGATIHTSLTSSSIVLSFTATPSLFQLSQSFLHLWIVTSYHSKKRKSHLEPSVTLRARIEQDSTAKRRCPHPSLTRANFSPQRNLCFPGKTECFVQILTFKSHPWCSNANAICQQWRATQKNNRNTLLKNIYP